MRKICVALAAVFLFILVAPAFAADVTGELVDRACYMKDKVKNVGAAHQECAQTCAKKGQAVALVTEKGEVYTLAGDLIKDSNAKLVPHMSHKVILTGEISEKDGNKIITATALKMAPKS